MFALAVTAIAAIPAQDKIVEDYMLCVRRAAVRLERSEDAPEDVAKAAVFLCQREETRAFNIDVSQANQLRATAIFYGSAQAVAARLCRRTGDCGLAPVPR